MSRDQTGCEQVSFYLGVYGTDSLLPLLDAGGTAGLNRSLSVCLSVNELKMIYMFCRNEM